MPRPLNEQTVVIAGASSGIGRSAALRFAGKGASVVLAARNEEALHKQVAAEIGKHGGDSPRTKHVQGGSAVSGLA